MDESPKPPEPAHPAATPPGGQPTKPRSRFRRWTRRVVKTSLILFVVLATLSVCLRTYYRIVGHRELRDATARLDAEEPGWQIAELNSARKQPSENENSAPIVARVYAL